MRPHGLNRTFEKQFITKRGYLTTPATHPTSGKRSAPVRIQSRVRGGFRGQNRMAAIRYEARRRSPRAQQWNTRTALGELVAIPQG